MPANDAAADAVAAPQCTTATDCAAPNGCQLPICTPKGTCAYAPRPDAAACDDGNACTTKDQCFSGQCSGSGQLQCEDATSCTKDSCNPISGCVNLAVAISTACDDGDPCTQGDTCLTGKCEGGGNICQCQNNSDCGKFEDGNACNGILYCDKSAGSPYLCKVNPASLVVCNSENDGQCQKNTCIPSTGQCKLIVAPPNTPCSDGDSCTAGDFCESGLCAGGTNTCYCKKDSDCKDQEDGNLCNGSLYCNKGISQCVVNPVTVVTCQTVDNTACSKNLCSPKEGKCYYLPVNENKACDDGNECTPNESCQKGQCAAAIDTCECEKDADCLKKEDGNPCNGTLFCDTKAKKCVVNPVTVVKCDTDDDPDCMATVCNKKSGVCEQISLPKDGTACDDGNLCTPNSQCSSGSCVALQNLCECQKNSDCASKEDGNLCNGTLYCNPKTNKCDVNPATITNCPKAFDEQCLTNQCDPKTGGCGMKPAHQGNQCGDDQVCTGSGWCDIGVCDVSVKAACECVEDSDCGKLDDGDLCNGTLYCDKSGKAPVCKVNLSTIVTCKSVNNSNCEKNKCQPVSGACAMVAVYGACDDALACTTADACAGGKCAGLPNPCDDNDACTVDACKEPQGCVHLAIGASSCDDNDVCTSDSCDSKYGCLHGFTAEPCNDGSACTTGDQCKNGVCSGGPKDCNDNDLCTTDSCEDGIGCKHAPSLENTPCSDGNGCTVTDGCKNGNCVGVSKVCDDGNPCTTDACEPKSGCTAIVTVGGLRGRRCMHDRRQLQEWRLCRRQQKLRRQQCLYSRRL